MKKIYLKTLLFSVMACFTACDSLLDLNPEDAISKKLSFRIKTTFSWQSTACIPG